MTFINLLGIILLIIILIIGSILRSFAKKILKSLEGFGGMNKRGNEKGNLISKG